MPSLLNHPRGHSTQLLFKKKTGKWTKRHVTIKESSDKKHYLEIYRPHRPVTRAIRKFGSDTDLRVDISIHSHAVVRDLAEDKTCKLLTLVPLKKTKPSEPQYQFAAYSEQEYNDLDNLANSVETLCDMTSFEVSVDADPNSCVPSGPTVLHIYKHNACLTSRSPCIRVLHQWELIEPLAEFQWERHGFRIIDHHNSNLQCFLFVNSQDDIQTIQEKININCKKIYSSNSVNEGVNTRAMTIDDALIPCQPPFIQNEIHPAPCTSSPQLNEICDSTSVSDIETSPVHPRRQSTSNTLVKEHVEIRHPGHQTTRRCNSDTAIQRQSHKENIKLFKSHSFDKNNKNKFHKLNFGKPNGSMSSSNDTLDEPKNSNLQNQHSILHDSSENSEDDYQQSLNGSDITQYDSTQYYANVQLRPQFYMYMNVMRDDDILEPEAPNTYVNIFSGSSFKGCYENWQLQSSIYSTIPAVIPPPPLPPRPSPAPKLPPRRHKMDEWHSIAPGMPPPLPPKPKSPRHLLTHSQAYVAPRIQVALFAANPVSGRVWFLRVAFMHQDGSDSTLKRVKDIEAFSNHRLLKTNSLEVTKDLSMEVTVNSNGFLLLNGNKQNIEVNDIEDLRKGDWFVVEFHIQNSDENENHLMGNVSIGPQQTTPCRRACKADMGIDEIFQRKVSYGSPSGCPVRRSILSDYNKRQKVCRTLDVTICSQNHDWRQVAGSLGFTHAEIMELQDKACRSVNFSPTDEVLTIWERREPNCSLEQLVNILRELGRLDVVQDLGYSITLES